EGRGRDVRGEGLGGQERREGGERGERAQESLRRFAAEHPDIAVSEEDKTQSQRVQDVSGLLTKVETDRMRLETRVKFLSGADRDALAYFLDKPDVQKLYLQLMDLQAQQAALTPDLGP